MTQHAKKMIARFCAAQLFSRAATGGHDQPVAEVPLARSGDGFIAARLFLHLDDIAAAHHVHSARLQREAQHIHHAVRLIGQRIHPARLVCHGQKSQRAEQAQRVVKPEV